MTNISNDRREVTAEGCHFVAWIKFVATDQDLQNLPVIEYSNDYEIWKVRIIDRDWIEICTEREDEYRRRPIELINERFYVHLPADRFDPWPGPISKADRAREYLQPLHLTLAELPDGEVITLCDQFASWIDKKEVPGWQERMTIYEIASRNDCQDYPRFARSILPIFKTWMDSREKEHSHVDCDSRLHVAVLQRHTGKILDAIQTTEFVALLPKKSDRGRHCDDQTLAFLSSTRAAALMDRSEQTANATYLLEARSQANRVNKITGKAMELYLRLKSLEKALQ